MESVRYTSNGDDVIVDIPYTFNIRDFTVLSHFSTCITVQYQHLINDVTARFYLLEIMYVENSMTLSIVHVARYVAYSRMSFPQ